MGEWESAANVSGYNGMTSLKIRPKAVSRHGRQWVYDWNGALLFNIGKVGEACVWVVMGLRLGALELQLRGRRGGRRGGGRGSLVRRGVSPRELGSGPLLRSK